MTLTAISEWLAGKLVALTHQARFVPDIPESAQSGLASVLLYLIDAFILFNVISVLVMIIILALRKVVGFMQARIGPRYVGPHGMLQTAADAVKLMAKEDIIPTQANYWVFVAAPFVVFVPAFCVFVTIPFGDPASGFLIVDLNIGVLYILAITSLTVIGIVMAGWSSGNKWSILGGMRAAAQLVSYEVPMTIALAVPVLMAGSLSLPQIVGAQIEASNWGFFTSGWWFGGWNIFGLAFLAFVVYFICGLAETNQTPFDLPEAESELVAGYNVEYSGMKFALFFLAEFANSFVVAAIAVHLFLGGWHAPYLFKVPVAIGAFILWWRLTNIKPWVTTMPNFPVFFLLTVGRTLGLRVPDNNKVAKIPLVGYGPFPGRYLLAVCSFVALLLMPDSGWGSAFWFLLKAAMLLFGMMWIRATLPRVRIDQLMEFSWKILIPVALFDLALVAFVLVVK